MPAHLLTTKFSFCVRIYRSAFRGAFYYFTSNRNLQPKLLDTAPTGSPLLAASSKASWTHGSVPSTYPHSLSLCLRNESSKLASAAFYLNLSSRLEYSCYYLIDLFSFTAMNLPLKSNIKVCPSYIPYV